MVGCILTGHGTFAEGLAGALQMVGGQQDDFQPVSFHEDEAGTYPQKLHEAIAQMAEKCGEVVVFCDLFGGTPFNQSMIATQQTPGVQVVTGTNLPMLLECVTSRTESTTADEVVATALEIGRMGIDSKKLEVAAFDDEDE